MASTLNQMATSTTQVGAGVTRNFLCCSGGGSAVTLESSTQRTERTGGTYSGYYVRVLTNVIGDVTFRFRKNTANGNQVLNFAAGETGVKQDVTNSDSVIVTDIVNYQAINVGAGDISLAGMSTKYAPSLNTVQHHSFSTVATAVAAATTVYYSISGSTTLTVLADKEIKIGITATYKNMGIRVTTNTIDVTGTSVFTSMKNGAAGNVTITFASGETGLKEDLVNTDGVVVTDLYAIRLVNTGVAGSISPAVAWISQETTNNKTDYVGSFQSTRVAAQTRYFDFVGISGASSTESPVQFIAQVGCILSNMRSYVSANTWTGNYDIVFRKNTANGNQTLTFATTVTGWLEDAVNTDTVVASDLINYRAITAAGSGSVTSTVTVITAEMAAEGSASTLLLMGAG